MTFNSSNGRWDPNSSLRLVFVFVVPPDPELPCLALVPGLRRPVEEPVVRHQELDPATRHRIRLIHGPVLERERGKTEQLGQIAVDVGAALLRIAERHRGKRAEPRGDRLTGLLKATRE